MSLLDALLRGGTTASRLATRDPNVTVRLDTADPPNDTGGQVPMTAPGGTSITWVTPSEGGSSAPVARNPLLDPPTVNVHADDDEFSSGSPDLAARGWVIRSDADGVLTRAGDVQPPHVGDIPYNLYRSSIIGGRFYVQLPRYNAYPGNHPGVKIYKQITGGLSGTGAIYAATGVTYTAGGNPGTGFSWVFCATNNSGALGTFVRIEASDGAVFNDSVNTQSAASNLGAGDVLVLAHLDSPSRWYPYSAQSWSDRIAYISNTNGGSSSRPLAQLGFSNSGVTPADMYWQGIAVGFQNQAPQSWVELKFFRRITDANTWIYRP